MEKWTPTLHYHNSIMWSTGFNSTLNKLTIKVRIMWPLGKLELQTSDLIQILTHTIEVIHHRDHINFDSTMTAN